MDRLQAETPPGPLAALLARWATRRSGAVLLVWALALLLAGGLAWARLGVRTDRMSLIGEQHAFNREFARLTHDFPDLDGIVVVASAEREADALALLEELAAGLAADPRFAGTFHRVPPEAFRGQGLLFLPLAKLGRIEERLGAALPALSRLLPDGLPALLRHSAGRVEERMRAGATSASAGDEEELRFLERLLDGLEGALDGREAGPPPWADWVPAEGALDGLVRTGRPGELILLARAAGGRDAAARAAAVDGIRERLRQLAARHPAVRAELTGSPVLELDEMRTWSRDAVWATLFVLLGVTAMTAWAMRSLVAPLLVSASILAAAALTLGLAAIWPGELNLISIAFCALLLGLGVGPTIHLMIRKDEERAAGQPPEAAWARAFAGAGSPVAAGACTTALAFLATLFTRVEAIREFGVVAGAGVMLALLASVALFPALVERRDRRTKALPPGGGGLLSELLLRRADALVSARPGLVAAIGLGVTLACAAFALLPDGEGRRRLRWEGNLLQLQADLPSVRLASEVLADRAVAGMFAAVVVDGLDELVRVEGLIEGLPSVHRTESILDVIPPDQPGKLELLARLGALLSRVPPAGAGVAASPPELQAALSELSAAILRAGDAALGAGRGEATRGALQLGERLELLAGRVGAADPAAAARVAAWETGLRGELSALLTRLAEECRARPLRPEELPEELLARFRGQDGRYLLRVYPKEDPWDPEQVARFVDELRAPNVAPDASGVPVQFHETGRLLREGYWTATWVALGFLLFYLLLHFRGLVHPLVVVAALLCGMAWAAGAMALLGVPLNPANLIALPLTVGIGADAAIHLVWRAREVERGSLAGPGSILDSAAGRAALLSAAATVVGFGALGAASHHRGVANLGFACALGVGATLASAVVLVPAILRLRRGPWAPPRLVGLPGPKIGPGGAPVRPPVQEPPLGDR